MPETESDFPKVGELWGKEIVVGDTTSPLLLGNTDNGNGKTYSAQKNV